MYRGSRLSLVAAALLALLAGAGAARAQQEDAGSPFFVQRAAWPDAMSASRARFQELKDQAGGVALGAWHATAPLPAQGFSDALFPEQGVDLAALDAGGEPLWREHPEWIDGQVHDLPPGDATHTYLFRTISAAAPAALVAAFGSDDGLGVWLNGVSLLSRDVPRAAAPGQDFATLSLAAGENRLLIKIHNIAGGYAFCFALEDPIAGLWQDMRRAFPEPCRWLEADLSRERCLAWLRGEADAELGAALVESVLEKASVGEGELREACAELRRSGAGSGDVRWLALYEQLCRVRAALAELDALDFAAWRRAVEDLTRSFPGRYSPAHAERLRIAEEGLPALRETLQAGDLSTFAAAAESVAALEEHRSEDLLSNPLLDFEHLLLIRRRADSPNLGLPQNWQGNCSLPRSGFDDEIRALAVSRLAAGTELVFRPESPRMLADIDLHFGGERLLFSMPDERGRWQIFELGLLDGALRQVTPGGGEDVDNYDACYLPDGRIVFDSTRVFQGIPCVGGADAVANLFLLDEQTGDLRQLCFDQDHDWCPTVLGDGRVLFTRWEYSDTPHYFSRLLMAMNPDGTGQMEFYGSNSYWPNSLFYARPIPGHPTRVAAIVSGHHGVPRMGELLILDPALGRHEADGVVQRIPGFGQEVEPIIADQLVDQSWPKFLHPFPLSDRHFLVACQPGPGSLWGIYLADVFDNLILLAEEPEHALFEPVPVQRTAPPPVIPDRVDLEKSEAAVFLADVYHGPGLAGVPRGTVKKLRVYSFHYGYNDMGGHINVGVEGPWDVHRILGTVPVYEDGSASFLVPANVPLAVQPLDAEGRALQLMRSWFVGMPGEVVSCAGCHERQNTASPVKPTLAARNEPLPIEPWRGPERGFSFKREVQPVLDRYCAGCHDGSARPDGRVLPDLSRKKENGWGNFTPSYLALHPYVRRPGPESDYHLLSPLEFHASTSELIQMLEKGHNGVALDEEAFDRLVTWIDLNVPDHGTWSEHAPIPHDGRGRRQEMLARNAGVFTDPEAYPDPPPAPLAFAAPAPAPAEEAVPPSVPGWPFDAEAARQLRERLELPAQLRLDLGEGVTLDLVLVPPGSFAMGASDGFPDEAPHRAAAVERPFYLGTTEVTCEQFQRFRQEHFNGYHDQRHKDHTTPGYPAHGPKRPAIRVSWEEAMFFCAWLSAETGCRATLPTEAEWEWACRAGADTAFSFGALDADFAPFANLGDASLRLLAVTGVNPQPIPNPNQYEDFLPKEARCNDGQRLMADVALYQPNAWGLFDMHGNVCEWTLSDYRPYPYRAADGRNDPTSRLDKVVRGGPWSDRPQRARSAWRLGYRPYQKVHDVGFRVAVHP
ncbi:MAG: SUMF1/EgtB/PvdO family nonheme iron enzyme [Planctomycetes bacterium]|nr:SUMF1/EgtB/PvdO family nonheme iron enzyme [Planctomycetota bacterium]